MAAVPAATVTNPAVTAGAPAARAIVPTAKPTTPPALDTVPENEERAPPAISSNSSVLISLIYYRLVSSQKNK
jgi:hypothetical protein